jgi:hypothetical protein
VKFRMAWSSLGFPYVGIFIVKWWEQHSASGEHLRRYDLGRLDPKDELTLGEPMSACKFIIPVTEGAVGVYMTTDGYLWKACRRGGRLALGSALWGAGEVYQ